MKRLGTAFGVHRAFDTAGAVIGPVAAYFILRRAPEQYDAVFVVSFLVALVGLAVLILFVQNKQDDGRLHLGASWRGAFALLRRDDFRILVTVGMLVGLFTIADAFVYLTLANEPNFNLVYFPLLATGMAMSYLVLAIPFGHGADRIGRSPRFPRRLRLVARCVHVPARAVARRIPGRDGAGAVGRVSTRVPTVCSPRWRASRYPRNTARVA